MMNIEKRKKTAKLWREKNKEYLKIFRNIQKVALSDRLPARLAAYTFWSLLLLLLMLLLGAVALAVAVAFAVAV